jgi:feruloyl esterase
MRSRTQRSALVVVAGLMALLVAASPASAATCESLATAKLTNGAVTLAQPLAAGAFTQPGGRGGANAFADLPAFCRVAATLTPTKESDIKVELWLPASGWNGKFQAVGNGGWNGNIDTNALSGALRRGYAGASTDGGHQGGAGAWMQNPEKLADWGYRAVHEMAAASKSLINAFYGEAPRFSYFTGCSAGGRQALKTAQRYPADFDGIVAGSPGLDWTGRAAGAVRVAQIFESDPARRVPAEKFKVIHAAVMQQCDALDGVTDGVLENPMACKFDPAVLACKGTADASCLAPGEVETVRAIYASPANPRTKREITGLAPGSELQWTELGWSGPARSTGLEFFRFASGNPQWNVAQFKFETDIVTAEEKGDAMNALDTNLKPFFDRGGRLIQYHGWNDPQISPANSTQYYRRVVDAMGGAARVSGNYRLFMVPGMNHCAGGSGTSTFDMLTALEQWVEGKKAPDAIPASRVANGAVVRTRPLCPYPQVASYKGSGSTDEAANFVCK